jgi:hypothetical protein
MLIPVFRFVSRQELSTPGFVVQKMDIPFIHGQINAEPMFGR